MQILRDFEDFLRGHEAQILKNCAGFHPFFARAVWEMLLNGGKRFRPLLLLSVVKTFAPKSLKNAMVPALAIEVLHTYSLIHDDLPCMDDATLRRNHPTLHKKYDEASAILVGDALNSYAFFLLARAKFPPSVRVKLIEILAHDAGLSGMVAGQAMDLYFEGKRLNLLQTKIIHTNKTAKIIAASLCMGGEISRLDPKTLRALRDFGLLLGLFFQARDDIIDVVYSAKNSGKSAKKDAKKNGYVNLLGLDRARAETQKLAQKIQKNFAAFPENLRKNLAFLEEFLVPL